MDSATLEEPILLLQTISLRRERLVCPTSVKFVALSFFCAISDLCNYRSSYSYLHKPYMGNKDAYAVYRIANARSIPFFHIWSSADLSVRRCRWLLPRPLACTAWG